MTRIFTVLFIFLFAYELTAQQFPLFTQYREHQMLLNPASMSSDQFGLYPPLFYTGMSARYQWTVLKNPPITGVGYFEHQLTAGDYDYNMLYGVVVLHDDTGPHSTSGLYGRYAYQLSLDSRERHRLNIGLALGVLQHRFNPFEGICRDSGDPQCAIVNRYMLLDLSLGAFYYGELGGQSSENYIYAGLSAIQFPQSLQLSATNDKTSANRVVHYYLTAGMYYRVMDGLGDFFIEPSIWLKYVNDVPIQSNLNLRLFLKSFWIGGGASMSRKTEANTQEKSMNIDLIHGDFGVKLNNVLGDYSNLKIGFGVDWGLNSYLPSLGTSYEVNVSYSWGTAY